MRYCHDCAATPEQASFPGKRKPHKRPDRCVDCLADSVAGSLERVAQRKAEIAALQQTDGYRAPKPPWTTPLFSGTPAKAPPARIRTPEIAESEAAPCPSQEPAWTAPLFAGLQP